jgi:hypothetical protein
LIFFLNGKKNNGGCGVLPLPLIKKRKTDKEPTCLFLSVRVINVTNFVEGGYTNIILYLRAKINSDFHNNRANT